MSGRVGAVIVTNIGRSDRLERCLDALLADRDIELAVVVDNSGSPARATDDDRVHVVNTDNRGYGAAVNEGVAALVSAVPDVESIAVLNDDVQVTPGWTQPLVAAIADDTIGAAQPSLLVAGSDPPIVNSLGVRIDRFGAGSDVGDGRLASEIGSGASDIDAFTGGAVVVRRAMFDELGGFDERYFLYYEDVDLALRGRERGWRFRHEPSSIVWHEVGATSAGLGDDRLVLQERNRLRTTVRFGDSATIARGLWLSLRRLRHPPRRAHLRSLVSGLAVIPSALADRRRARCR